MFCFGKDRGPSEKPMDAHEISQRKKKKDSAANVMLVVGHSPGEGMTMYNGNAEQVYWQKAMADVERFKSIDLVDRHNIGKLKTVIYPKASYKERVKVAVEEAKALDIDVCVELHINAAGIPEARGAEHLVAKGDRDSASLATLFAGCYRSKTGIQLRGEYLGWSGVKGLSRKDRGHLFVREMQKQGIRSFIFEPFFGDYRTEENKRYLDRPDEGRKELVEILLNGLYRALA